MSAKLAELAARKVAMAPDQRDEVLTVPPEVTAPVAVRTLSNA